MEAIAYVLDYCNEFDFVPPHIASFELQYTISIGHTLKGLGSIGLASQNAAVNKK